MTESPKVEASAQSSFEQGVAAFMRGDGSSAHAAFERAHRKDPREPRYMSWYGMTLVLVEKNSNLGVLLCDQALRGGGPDPDLLLNQARVHLALNQRERTVRAIERGLELWPNHAGLQLARETLGWRRQPALPFLSRNSPLNRMLGRLRHRFARRPGTARSAPMTLGVILQLHALAPVEASSMPPGAPTPPTTTD